VTGATYQWRAYQCVLCLLEGWLDHTEGELCDAVPPTTTYDRYLRVVADLDLLGPHREDHR
jgi:hypothetical protein